MSMVVGLEPPQLWLWYKELYTFYEIVFKTYFPEISNLLGLPYDFE